MKSVTDFTTVQMSSTDFMRSVRKGDILSVRELLEKGVDLNVRDKYGFTPLHFASIYEHLDVVKLLLEYGADPNIQNKSGETALSYAHIEEELDIAKLLILYGGTV